MPIIGDATHVTVPSCYGPPLSVVHFLLRGSWGNRLYSVRARVLLVCKLSYILCSTLHETGEITLYA